MYGDGEFDQARQMLAQPAPDIFRVDEEKHNERKRDYWNGMHIEGMRRTWVDVVAWRQIFRFFYGKDVIPASGFEAERGRITPTIFDSP